MTTGQLESVGGGRYRIIGAMNFETAVQLLKQSDAAFGLASPTEIDLSQVSETDSAGLALILEWVRAAHARGSRFKLVNAPGQLAALARISEVEELLGLDAQAAQASAA